MDWQVVPIDSWPGPLTITRRPSPFRRTVSYRSTFDGSTCTRTEAGVDWSATTTLLFRELEHLRARNILLQLAISRSDLRLDGWIRADARPEHPGVILTFDTLDGTLSYPCDTFLDWQANVRAVAVALEDLRRIDRYGVSRNGAQYRGFLKLPTGRDAIVSRGRQLIRQYGGETEAIKATHPDTGGDRDEFEAVLAARAGGR